MRRGIGWGRERTGILVLALLLGLALVWGVGGSDAADGSLQVNGSSYVDLESDAVVINGHVFSYDVMSGATVLPSRVVGKGAEPMDAAEKERKMFWSVQPPRGIVRGEYYFENYSFGGKNGSLDRKSVV